MRAVGISQRTDEGELVGLLGEAREQLANLHAGDVGADGPELAANLAGCVGLEVEHVDVRRPAGQVDVDDGLVGLARAGERFELEQLREGQAASSHATDLEEFTARKPVAVGVAGDALAKEVDHIRLKVLSH